MLKLDFVFFEPEVLSDTSSVITVHILKGMENLITFMEIHGKRVTEMMKGSGKTQVSRLQLLGLHWI